MILKERLPACILQTTGTNCDKETAYGLEKAFGIAESKPKITHLNELIKREDKLANYKIAALAGGFANGDFGGGAGRILALNLVEHLKDQLLEFKEKGGLIIGVCNGFQGLVRAGLLPFGNIGEIKAALDVNDVGHFDNRWVYLRTENSPCVFLRETGGEIVNLQTAHREGNFTADNDVLERIENENLVVFRYCDVEGNPTQEFPDNPNGSMNAIAAITNPKGDILGIMPHPERFVEKTQHPNWRRMPKDFVPDGLKIIQKMVSYASQM